MVMESSWQFQPVVLQAQQTTEIIQAMNTLIAMLERTLGYSAQEVGAAASHQQSVAEVNVIAGSTSTRINLTGGFIDDAIYAGSITTLLVKTNGPTLRVRLATPDEAAVTTPGGALSLTWEARHARAYAAS